MKSDSKYDFFSFVKMHLNMPSAKWRPFFPEGNALNQWWHSTVMDPCDKKWRSEYTHLSIWMEFTCSKSFHLCSCGWKEACSSKDTVLSYWWIVSKSSTKVCYVISMSRAMKFKCMSDVYVTYISLILQLNKMIKPGLILETTLISLS